MAAVAHPTSGQTSGPASGLASGLASSPASAPPPAAPRMKENLPYTEIKPLDIPKEALPTAKKVLNAALLIFTTTAFFSVSGACTVALAEWTCCTIVAGGIIAGVVGVIIGSALVWLAKNPTLLEGYRLDTLKQLEPLYHSKRVKQAFRYLEKLFANPLTKFNQTYENHKLHNQITVITSAIDRDRPDVKKVWEQFLNHLDKTEIVNADGKKITLDFSLELLRIEGKGPELVMQQLSASSPLYDKDLKEVEEIQKVAFGTSYTLGQEALKKSLAQRGNQCFVVRNKETQEVYAFARIEQTPEGLCLAGIARKPGLSRRGVGDDLLKIVIKTLWEGQKFHLSVRQSNTGTINLYRKHGFRVTEQMHFPRDPEENGYKMHYVWPSPAAQSAQ